MATQKLSVQKALRKKFRKYIHAKADFNGLVLLKLQVRGGWLQRLGWARAGGGLEGRMGSWLWGTAAARGRGVTRWLAGVGSSAAAPAAQAAAVGQGAHAGWRRPAPALP